ncbi:MAG: tRNA 2-thiouridine(34) synthase MnmA [Pirellulales bacterium]|nr:tRNA 2-thiouridine(34) synthase MnmA [Pirellulales bacterium]
MARIVLAMSGGVDSSVAACLLREEGHEVLGVFMRHGVEGSERGTGCCSAADAADARRVADRLGIPFYALNFDRQFERIIDYFVAEYSAGRTPNPCIMCNTWLKFGALFQYADGVGAEFVATGHHARIVEAASCRFPANESALLRGLDAAKDQSYALFGIARHLLPRIKFPVGEYRKEEIRRLAAEHQLDVSEKPDSQEICFIPDQDHGRFIREHRLGIDTSGEFVTVAGEVVGRHSGIEQFTVGQRKGLGLAFGQPRYVVRIEPATRRVVLGEKSDLARHELTAAKANWLVEGILPSPIGRGAGGEGLTAEKTPKTFTCTVKIRYRSPAYPATVEILENNRFHVHFHQPVHGVAPGQAAVCYLDDRVLGGGWIE